MGQNWPLPDLINEPGEIYKSEQENEYSIWKTHVNFIYRLRFHNGHLTHVGVVKVKIVQTIFVPSKISITCQSFSKIWQHSVWLSSFQALNFYYNSRKIRLIKSFYSGLEFANKCLMLLLHTVTLSDSFKILVVRMRNKYVVLLQYNHRNMMYDRYPLMTIEHWYTQLQGTLRSSLVLFAISNTYI